MITKVYEKTGIKENNIKRKTQREILSKKNHKAELEKALLKGRYKKDNDLSLMKYGREYRKVEKLLRDAYDLYSYDINVLEMVKGYLEYFKLYGKEMTPLGLRNFRKGIESTLYNSKDKYSEKDEYDDLEDEAVFEFYFKYTSLIEDGDPFILEMLNFFRKKGFPIENTEDLIRVKSKVKTLTE